MLGVLNVKFLTGLAWVLATAGVPLEAPQSIGFTTTPPSNCRAKSIDWQPGHKLKISDFRGPTGRQSLSAEASTGIDSQSSGSEMSNVLTITIKSFFDPCESWMRSSERNAATLAHEQLHFDITELHARKLSKRYANELKNYKDFLRHASRIYEEIWAESNALQDLYDAEVYDSGAAQARWMKLVAEKLEEQDRYADKIITLPMK